MHITIYLLVNPSWVRANHRDIPRLIYTPRNWLTSVRADSVVMRIVKVQKVGAGKIGIYGSYQYVRAVLLCGSVVW